MRYLITLFLFGILLSCGNKKNTDLQRTNDISTADNSRSEVNDTLYVDHNLVVFLWPDSIEQLSMKEKYDEISYNKFVDDLTWYTEKAVEMLDSFEIDNRITDKDIVIFRNSKQVDFLYNRKEIQGNMILFNMDKDPLITSMTAYNRSEIIEYYR